MSSLHTLLKIAQRRLDELGVEAARIQQEADGLRMDAATLAAREQVEIETAAQNLAFMPMLPAYRARVQAQGAALRARAAEREATLGLIRERMATAYQEKSKFEQLIEQARIREQITRAAAEQAMLDEVAITRAEANR